MPRGRVEPQYRKNLGLNDGQTLLPHQLPFYVRIKYTPTLFKQPSFGAPCFRNFIFILIDTLDKKMLLQMFYLISHMLPKDQPQQKQSFLIVSLA